MLKHFLSHKYIIIFTLPFFLYFTSCAFDIPENSGDFLTPPYIENSAIDGDNIIINFYGNNDEYYFDGYNVYISETSMSSTSIASYKPVEIIGYSSTEPSFPLSPDDNDPGLLRKIDLYHYYYNIFDINENVKIPFSHGTTYYILLCSHHRNNGVNESGVSNQLVVQF